MTGKIGFCGKWMSATNDINEELTMNQKTTTITALSKLTQNGRVDRLLKLVANNLVTLKKLIEWVGDLPIQQRMFRMTSDLLPGYTHECVDWVYTLPEMRDLMEGGFKSIGEIARTTGVRLSFHPGQYCVINSTNEVTIQKAIKEFEYHTDMMQMLGYGGGWHPHGSSINIHVGGRAGGIAKFVEGWRQLSNDAKNLITVENDEFSFGLSDVLQLREFCPIVFDLHHEWIHSQGSYVQPDDSRIPLIIESWRGTQPLGHFSTSHENTLKGHAKDVLPDFVALRATGMSLRDLRAHSAFCWNTEANKWASSHLSWMDIEVEAKQKNLASLQLYQQNYFDGKGNQN